MNPPSSSSTPTGITVAIILAPAASALIVTCGRDEEADYSGDAISNPG